MDAKPSADTTPLSMLGLVLMRMFSRLLLVGARLRWLVAVKLAMLVPMRRRMLRAAPTKLFCKLAARICSPAAALPKVPPIPPATLCAVMDLLCTTDSSSEHQLLVWQAVLSTEPSVTSVIHTASAWGGRKRRGRT